MASPTTPALASDLDRKGIRTASPSISSGRDGSNVVDHLAPGVTEHVPHIPKKKNTVDRIITVQPLRKDEMQVRLARSRAIYGHNWTRCADLLQPSYAQDLGIGAISMVSTALSSTCLVLLWVALARSLACPARTRSVRLIKVCLPPPP
jgi:hypothetical protein